VRASTRDTEGGSRESGRNRRVVCVEVAGSGGGTALARGADMLPTEKKTDLSVADDDRRVFPRLKPEDVPWIREIKPSTGDGARLLNISRTGVLLETTARLQPGRRSTITIVNESDQKERAEGRVIRTELVSIGKGGELIYRTAMAFTTELDLKAPGTVPAAAAEACVQSQLEGPLQALWATTSGSRQVQVTHLTTTGCYVQVPGAGIVGEWASVAVFFSPVRSLTLQGRVAAVEPERGCLLQFQQLAADTRRALRVEIQEGIAHGAAAPPQPVAVVKLVEAGVEESISVEWRARAGTLHANQW